MRKLNKYTVKQLNNAMRDIKLECLKHDDCTNDCPFCEYTENNIPHCTLQEVPQFWKRIKVVN